MNLTAIWSDGHKSVTSLATLSGLVREVNGNRERPLVILYEGDIEAIQTSAVRERFRRDLRLVGAYHRV